MAVNKNFVVKHGLEVKQDLLYADAQLEKVGIGTTLAYHKLHVAGDLKVDDDLQVVGVTSLGTNTKIIDGTLDAVNTGVGTYGQFLIATGAGIAWTTAPKLRKVEIFIRILKQKESPKLWNFLLNKLPDKSFLNVKKRFSVYRQISRGVKWYTENYTLNEDLFWSDRAKLFYPNFKIAPLKVGLKFAFDMHPKFCFKRNKNTLPFGAHGWQKRDKTFWLDILRDIND